jgi:hypothetical protein
MPTWMFKMFMGVAMILRIMRMICPAVNMRVSAMGARVSG